jgi:hypothetical protein
MSEERPQRHDLDRSSLVFGVLFVALGLLFLVGNVDFGNIGPAWRWALGLATAGSLILALGARRHTRR